jgi:hypothetical protein
MRFSIVCPDEHIEEVREVAKSFITSHITLTTPLSSTGFPPQTHWFCTCDLSDEGIKKIHSLKKHTSIYSGSPKSVLEEIGLKIIK